MEKNTDMIFYYDELQHSQIINEKYLIEKGKGYDTYIGCFLGIPTENIEGFEQDYTVLEKKWIKILYIKR